MLVVRCPLSVVSSVLSEVDYDMQLTTDN
jgi:hypothetical protein